MKYKNILLPFLSINLFFCISCTGKDFELIDAAYFPKESKETPHPELTNFDECAYFDENGELRLVEEHLNKISFENGLAKIAIAGKGWYYVNQKGKAIKVMTYDNGPDYFKDGLARVIRDGKYGYIDKNLDIVIEPKYDFAGPFEKGRARICLGGKLEKKGEHSFVVGGKWGLIDMKGKLVVDAVHNKEELNKIITNK